MVGAQLPRKGFRPPAQQLEAVAEPLGQSGRPEHRRELRFEVGKDCSWQAGGASRPSQALANATPGRASAAAGTSGSTGLRRGPFQTSARRRPSRIAGKVTFTESMVSCTRPASRSASPAALVRYGTCSRGIPPSADLRISTFRCGSVPLPVE